PRAFALPDANVASIADLQHQVLASLVATVAVRGRALVPNNEAIATASRATHLVELRTEPYVAEGLIQRYASRHKSAWIASEQAVFAVNEPGCTQWIVRPVRQWCHETFREQHAVWRRNRRGQCSNGGRCWRRSNRGWRGRRRRGRRNGLLGDRFQGLDL